MTRGGSVYRIVPVYEGAKSSGVLQIVVGAVALVAAFFTAGASMAAWGAAMSATAISATSILTGVGVSMMLGGVSRCLRPSHPSARVNPPARTTRLTTPSGAG